MASGLLHADWLAGAHDPVQGAAHKLSSRRLAMYKACTSICLTSLCGLRRSPGATGNVFVPFKVADHLAIAAPCVYICAHLYYE